MAVNPANMESCFPKSRCLSGPNEGVAYDRDSPCGGIANVAFNPVSCDCEETILCVGSDECGFDIDWEIEAGANTIWSMKPCGASSCTIVCASDEYRECATYTANSGSVYLDPGKCLRVVKLLTDGPCPNDSPAPGGAYTRMDWYECNPDVTDPSYTTCSTPVAQMPGGGYCSTVMTGPGIVETGRVRRTKLATQSQAIGVNATTYIGGFCGSCGSPDQFSNYTRNITWPAPVDESSYSTAQYSWQWSGSQCGSGATPGTWLNEIGAHWVQIGTGWDDGSTTQAKDGTEDYLFATATIGRTNGGYQEGQVCAVLVASSWVGATDCTRNAHTLTSHTTTAFGCYTP